jgi:hypothetical protein
MSDEHDQDVPEEAASDADTPAGESQNTQHTSGARASVHNSVDKTADDLDIESGRKRGDWKTRYDGPALKGIYREFWYLVALLLFAALLMAYAACTSPATCPCGPGMRQYLLSSGGGLIGGWMFTTKWLIHAVVSGFWDEDRRIWRFLNPFVSACLALTFCAIIRSGLFQVLTPTSMDKPSAAIAVGFLVGYSSDRAIGKLGDIADTLFGTKHGLLDGSNGNSAKPKTEQVPGESESES